MTRALCSVVAVLQVVALPAAAATVEETLMQLEKDSWVAWQKHNGAFFERLLSDDHVEVHTNGVAIDKAAIVAHVASTACVVANFRLDQFRFVQFEESTALLTYRASQDTDCRGMRVPSPVWVSSLFIRRRGAWKNALYVHTPIMQP